MVKIFGLLFIVVLIILSSLFYYFSKHPTAESSANKKDHFLLKLQLSGTHSAQYAGNYFAKDEQYYAQNQIDLTIYERMQSEKSAADAVLAGDVDIAITTPWEFLNEAEKGKKIIAIAAIYQTSPAAAFALKSSNIQSPAQFRNKKLGVFQNNQYSKKFYQLLMNLDEVSSTSATMVNIDTDVAKSLFEKKVDVVVGYRTEQEFLLKVQTSEDIVTIRPENFGMELYDDVYIVSEEFLNEHPGELRRFMKATQQGWLESFKDSNKSHSITKKYALNFNNDALLTHILEQSEPLIIPTNGHQIGSMSFIQWKKMYEYLKQAGLIERDFDISTVFTNKLID